MVETTSMPGSTEPRVLFVLFQMGTLDHTFALYRQIETAGAVAHVALAESSLELPRWFVEQLPGITVIPDPLDAIRERRYDAVVMQMPYDDLKDPVWATIGRDDAFAVYSGYGVFSVVWEHGEFGLDFYRRLSLLLASSPYQVERYLSSPMAPAQSVWSGDPLMYELVNSEPAAPPARPVILWAPYWSEKWVDGSPGFSTWKTTVHDVLAVARRHPEATFIVRGHPLMSVDGDDRESRASARAYRELLSLAQAHHSTRSMREDMLEATALLTDGISIIPYFAATGKPLAVVRRGRRWPPFNAAGRALVRASDTVHDSRSIRQWLGRAVRNEIPVSDERSELVAQIYPVRRESPGHVLLENLPRRSA